jgi:hypothetical protein
LALSSIVPGSTLTCTSLTQGDPSVYGNWFAKDGLTSTATFSIDGAVVDTWDSFGFDGQVIQTKNSTTQTAFATRYPLTGSGSHTYTVTVGIAGTGNPFTVLWMGSVAPVPPVNLGGVTQNPPRIAVGGVIRAQHDTFNPVPLATYNALALSAPTGLAADGAFIYSVNVRNYVDLDFATLDSDITGATLPNGLVVPESTLLPVHPNGGISNGVIVGGHRHLADAFLAAMPPPVSNAMSTTAPPLLQYLGTGADGANLTASGALSGDKYYTNFTVPFGNTVTVNQSGLTIHALGACNIYGNIFARGGIEIPTSSGLGGGAGAGSGGGTAAGASGAGSFELPLLQSAFIGFLGGGSAGAASGGNGGNGGNASVLTQGRVILSSGLTQDFTGLGGGNGATGGSAGGTSGRGGGGVTLICGSISGFDGIHTGVIDVSGSFGNPASANNTGAGSPGGGGVAVLSSQAPIAVPPTIYNAPGGQSISTVPYAVGFSGLCTVQPVLSLGVTSGALNGTATVVNPGVACGANATVGQGTQWEILGGGGTPGTATINPTWSIAGAVTSATVTPGTSSGYTQSTWTTSGNSGSGGTGWNYVVSGW